MRTIHMAVRGDAAELDSTVAGVQGSGNVDKLVVRFDESWAGYAKSACWWDAHGLRAGEPRLLTAELLVDSGDGRSYILLTPPEALRWPGKCTLVIDGWKEGCLARTVRQEFQVVPAPPSAKGTEVTPTQAQQLQSEIEALLDDMGRFAQSQHAQAVARTKFLQSVWETGERAWSYTKGYFTNDSGEVSFYFPAEPPKGGPRWREHPILGGEYKVTVTRGEKSTVQSVYYADVPIQVDGVTVWGGSEKWPLSGVDALKIEYVRYMEDQTFSAKGHLEKLCADAQTAKSAAQTARTAALGAQTAAEAAQSSAAQSAQDAQSSATQAAQAAQSSAAQAAAQAAQNVAQLTQDCVRQAQAAAMDAAKNAAVTDLGVGAFAVGVNGWGELVVTVDPGQTPPPLSLSADGCLVYEVDP